jgi:acid phosphatase
MRKWLSTIFFLVSMVALECGCGGSSSSSSPTSGGGNPTVPTVAHVFVVVEENHSFNDVVGNPNMPYFNSLISSGGLATQYFADAHPSLPNYFMLTAGATITSDDNFTGTVSQDNVVRALTSAGKSWRCYAESLPAVGYLGGDTGLYLRHHVPFTYFSDVQGSSAQAANIVPFTQFATDLSNGLPDYSFIVPDIYDDAHNCPGGAASCTDTQQLAALDAWLQSNLDGLIKSAAFQDSLVIITFDESEVSDTQYGGGHVATVIVSPKAKAGYRSTRLYQHESVLRLSMEVLGATDFPGNAANAADMVEFFR